ncbi:phospholipase A1-like [Oppia nitens]|uniref:phospholipase A1-like n=1 Tax=Oppia nitens TaxID=1686743 RepID=UPI0023DA6507|nr:phospholipase A1-like [Oppia nitens]
MGNTNKNFGCGGGHSTDDDDDLDDTVPVHPYWLGTHPEPWDIDRIQPELLVFRQNHPKLDLRYDMSAEQAVDAIVANELLAATGSRLVFIAHGFRSHKHTEWLHIMKDRLIDERDQTVAIVGWGKGSDIGVSAYEQAAANALAVGQWLAPYLRELRKRFPEISLWLIGHSLGAHLAGRAGRESQVKIDRITGLDPAGVGFQTENLDKRLNRTDARLVDVIHSDGKSVPYFGTLVPLGSVDFYPNYGWNQPTNDAPDKKPYLQSTRRSAKGQVSPYGSGFTVSHSRAIDYFMWSIGNSGSFRTSLVLEDEPDVDSAVHRVKRVDRETEMGYYTDQWPNNDLPDRCYYVLTNASEPWI